MEGAIRTKYQNLSAKQVKKGRLGGDPIFIPASKFQKNGVNSFFAALCKSYNGVITKGIDFDHETMSGPVFIRGFQGIKNHELIRNLIRLERDFYFVDSGYFGNDKLPSKKWHRVTRNDFQDCKIIDRDSIRRRILNLRPKKWRESGDNILICPPSSKSMSFFFGKKMNDSDVDRWIDGVSREVKALSDRPIFIRKKPRSRFDRVFKNPIVNDFLNVHALITYNSIAATEAIYNGIPSITLQSNAASAMSKNLISDINSLAYPDREAWLNHLSYCQFTEEEAANGLAKEILEGGVG